MARCGEVVIAAELFCHWTRVAVLFGSRRGCSCGCGGRSVVLERRLWLEIGLRDIGGVVRQRTRGLGARWIGCIQLFLLLREEAGLGEDGRFHALGREAFEDEIRRNG